MEKYDAYFSLARTALKVGLSSYGYEKGQAILNPDFLCNSISDTLKNLDILIITYSLNDNLVPSWDELDSLCDKNNVLGLCMVHYFGQAQNIYEFKKITKKYNILLIEDNAHGYGGYYNGKSLGTYGDIGFSSPRKFLNTNVGGCLYLKDKSLMLNKKPSFVLEPKRISFIKSIKKMIYYFPYIYRFLKKIRYRFVDFSDPYYFQESIRKDYYLEQDDIDIINGSDCNNIALGRRKLWIEWEEFAISNGLDIIFQKVHPESSPWAFPVYAKNIDHRNQWLKWGLKNNIHIFSWPALPSVEIQKKTTALMKWERLLCFSLDGTSPKSFSNAARNKSI